MAGLTDTQELLLVILIVIVFKLIFLACLCKIQKCSQVERNYSMTPRAMCRNLCRKSAEQDTQAGPTRTYTETSNDKSPPPYCAPPQYEDVCPEWYPQPPPYTVCMPEHELTSVSCGGNSDK